MLPTAEEKEKIQEAAISNPELPLGSAEQFLMMLASISELPARLNLWLFKLDYENTEKEVADPLMDLKQGVEDLQKNKTFKVILSVLLSIGNFLNGSESRGFQIEYLSKVPEIGSITRASRVDFEELENTIAKMQVDCKASWDHLKAIAKHDGPTQIKLKMSEFLADCAERIIVLEIIYKRVMTRFHRFLLWLGTPLLMTHEVKVQQVCSVVSEFALEYRTSRQSAASGTVKRSRTRDRNLINELEALQQVQQLHID
ncbi:FH1/FH2 domain-containing protein 3 [Portunus trituberculatus]|uniref:FH1/FH2 domain-containing protein 3 n=1 Tax=Portunus trituberculatus TaxID=210409 RepID=A0A5B7EEY5_PORTR|nr:FH1/FH2 domain-containing protein 3 [Portunus trituberculatus]